jgi:hypothetical protein
MTLDELVNAIGSLNENDKAALVGKLQASAEAPKKLRTLRAARAAATNKAVIAQMLGNAQRLGVAHLIDEDKPVDLNAINMALKGKDLESRFLLKSQLAEHGMV